MKKTILTLVLLLIIPIVIFAHPAKKVNVSYKNGKLIVEVIHPVNNVNSHYISQIVVNVDGKDVKTIVLTKQASPEREYQELTIPEIKSGSTVTVKSNCNLMGSKSAKITIP